MCDITDYWLLADRGSAALVSGDGSIDWLCLPRYDSPAIFGRLLDPRAGHWSFCPDARFVSECRYLPDTLVLQTTFRTESGAVRLMDAMFFADDPGSPHEVLRCVEGVCGRGRPGDGARVADRGPHADRRSLRRAGRA